jgi:hypothetical protein
MLDEIYVTGSTAGARAWMQRAFEKGKIEEELPFDPARCLFFLFCAFFPQEFLC